MIATSEQYAAMLDAASAGGCALPEVNVTSSQTLNGAMRGFAEGGADGIVQVTTGAAAYRGEEPLFHSHMFDGSTLPLEDNLQFSARLLDELVDAS